MRIKKQTTYETTLSITDQLIISILMNDYFDILPIIQKSEKCCHVKIILHIGRSG